MKRAILDMPLLLVVFNAKRTALIIISLDAITLDPLDVPAQKKKEPLLKIAKPKADSPLDEVKAAFDNR